MWPGGQTHTHFLFHLMFIERLCPEIDPLACNHIKDALSVAVLHVT